MLTAVNSDDNDKPVEAESQRVTAELEADAESADQVET